MERQLESGSSSDGSIPTSERDTVIICEKRGADELDGKEERPWKHVKMRDLQLIMLSSGINTHNPSSQQNKDAVDQLQGVGEKVSKTTDALLTVELGGKNDVEGGGVDRSGSTEVLVLADGRASYQSQEGIEEMVNVSEAILSVNSGATEVGNSEGEISAAMVKQIPIALDLNTKVGVADNPVNDAFPVSADNFDIPALSVEHNSVYGNKAGVDLNAEKLLSLGNQDPFHPLKSEYQHKTSEVSECGSTTGSQEEKDPMRIWQQMKQNGFLSSTLGSTQLSMPKQRGRKTKGDASKKKVDTAKKEQVDRVTKVAAPSGLLNELNPGIINHVRNKKQVHSIIEALVKSEKSENSQFYSKHTSQMNVKNKEIGFTKDLNGASDLGIQRLMLTPQDGNLHFSAVEKQTRAYATSMGKSLPFVSENTSRYGNSSMPYGVCGARSLSLPEDDTLALELSSTKGHENFSSLSHEESANLSCVSSLTVKAANVASQWLELLQQDIKGRLTALRRSKKRVRAVISTELPILLSKEVLLNQENDPHHLKSSVNAFSSNSAAEMHKAKWSALFSKMDQSLVEEERQLENWLYQVRDMQMHCEWGLQQLPSSMSHSFQQSRPFENSGSSIMDRFHKELSIRAAAASIYSACNYLSSNGNLSC